MFCLLAFSLGAQEFSTLVFSKTAGFRHASIETGVAALEKLALEYNFSMYHTEDANHFTDDNLAQYDVIIFLNTTGDILDDDQQASMERFVRQGKGFVGVHSATDTEYDWPWFVKLIGGNFDSHPKVQEARLRVVDHSHLSTQLLPSDWVRTDEWYNFKNFNPDVHVLLDLDESTYEGGNHGGSHPFAWYHEYDGGRVFYTCCGHTKETYEEHAFLAHLMGGIKYAAGKLEYMNTLSEKEEADGWRLLFDGKTTNGWRNYQKDGIGSSWVVKEGTLTLEVEEMENGRTRSKDGGDIITTEQFENFELALEWKISPCGNSGIMFGISEDSQYQRVWHTGPEMQVLDNTCHPDAKIHTHRAGDLYDLIACREETVKPAGEWNQVRIRIDDGKGTFWLNGVQVVEFEMFTPEWNAMVAESKFKDLPDFAKHRKGHISLQDHNDEVSYRNIKIKTW